VTRDDVTDGDKSVLGEYDCDGRTRRSVSRRKPTVRGRRRSEAPSTCADRSAASSSLSPVCRSTPSRVLLRARLTRGRSRRCSSRSSTIRSSYSLQQFIARALRLATSTAAYRRTVPASRQLDRCRPAAPAFGQSTYLLNALCVALSFESLSVFIVRYGEEPFLHQLLGEVLRLEAAVGLSGNENEPYSPPIVTKAPGKAKVTAGINSKVDACEKQNTTRNSSGKVV